MPLVSSRPFDIRSRRIIRRAERIAALGAVRRIDANGLIVTRPRHHAIGFPWAALLTILAGAFIIKALMLVQIGDAEMARKADLLAAGTLPERVAARIFQPDPLTGALAQSMSQLVR